MQNINQLIYLIGFFVFMVTSCMTLTVVNQDGIDDSVHHLIKKRQSRCNCFSSGFCGSDLNYDVACGCLICGGARPPPPPPTTLRTTTDSARCDRICAGRRRTTLDRCPTCYSGADKYAGGYYCCGGNTGATCGGYFSSGHCACRYQGTNPITLINDCVAYDGACGYFDDVRFDGACACFTCG
jgi:hypothetical protein